MAFSDKLVEEQDAAARHSLAAEELKRTCAEQTSVIEKLRKNEKCVLDQLESVKKELKK